MHYQLHYSLRVAPLEVHDDLFESTTDFNDTDSTTPTAESTRNSIPSADSSTAS
jgi:hypothetical protein